MQIQMNRKQCKNLSLGENSVVQPAIEFPSIIPVWYGYIFQGGTIHIKKKKVHCSSTLFWGHLLINSQLLKVQKKNWL